MFKYFMKRWGIVKAKEPRSTLLMQLLFGTWNLFTSLNDPVNMIIATYEITMRSRAPRIYVVWTWLRILAAGLVVGLFSFLVGLVLVAFRYRTSE